VDHDPRPARPRRARWLVALGAIGALIVVAVAVALTRPRPADPQRLVDVYLPGLRLGAPVSDSLRIRYRLRDGSLAPAPLSRGLRYQEPLLFLGPPAPDGPDGVDYVAVVLGKLPAEPLAPVERTDPATRLALSLPTESAVASAERRLRDAYGDAEERCFAEGLRTLYWRGTPERGGALLVAPTRATAYTSAFAARLVLGAERWESAFPDPTACPKP
jgi:hypothetical protein